MFIPKAKVPRPPYRTTWLIWLAAWLTACSGGSDVDVNTSGATAVIQNPIDVTVAGLTGSGLVLQNNTADNLVVSGNGSFAFATPMIRGDSYSITVLNQPSSPSQTCTVANGSGTVTSGTLGNISVMCVDKPAGIGASDLIGGMVEGLLGSGLVLQDNLGDSLSVAANGSFSFATPRTVGTPYAVSVSSPPIGPYQNCAVTNGAGTTGTGDVLNVVVACESNPNPTFTIGGTVSGISAGSTVVLQDNGRDPVTLKANGSFQFALAIPSGSSYNVTSSATGQQSQACAISHASGTVAGANVSDVVVTCVPNTVITATVSGLAAGDTLALQDNGSDRLTITQNGSVPFPAAIAVGATFNVTVAAQPTNPTQTCVIQNGTGTATALTAPTTVSCTTGSFTVGGTVSGLTGTGLVLQDNNGNDLAITAGGTFTFATPIASGSTFNVSVLAQPAAPSQTCTVTGGTGTIAGANVTGVVVTCTTNVYTVGGTVSGFVGAGLVLQDNGGNNLAIAGNGPFNFTAPIASGATFNVTVLTPPTGPTQTCNVVGGAGRIVGQNVTTVVVSCVTNMYTVGGVVTGLAGTGLVLQDNGGNNLPIAADGLFAFTAPVPSGATFNVAVLTQPTARTQTCTVAGGFGTIGNANVTTVVVSCVTNMYTVGGVVTGLAGTGLVLRDNGGNNLAVAANGVFTFSLPIASGTAYEVSVLTLPATPTQACAVTGGMGTIGAANVTTVEITCTTPPFTVGGTVTGLAGTGLVLQDNGGNNLPVSANGPFTFTTPLLSGTNYTAQVLTQPSTPTQQCTVAGATGTVTNANVTSVAITCTTLFFAVGGNTSFGNFPAQGLVLQNNGTGNLPAAPNAPFSFGVIQSGSAYDVTIASQPAGYACAVSNGVGTVTNAAIPNIAVSCSEIGGYLYVTNGGGNSISGFAIDINTGALQPLTHVVGAAGQPNAIVATTLTDSHLVDPSASAVGCPPPAIIYSPEKRNSPATASFVSADAYYSLGLYVANAGSSSVSAYSVNTSTTTLNQGSLSLSNNPFVDGGTAPTNLDFNSTYCAAYPVNSGTENIAVFNEDTATAALTQVETPVAAPANVVPVAAANAEDSDDGIDYEFVVGQTAGGGNIYAYPTQAHGELPPTPTPRRITSTGGIPTAVATAYVGQSSFIFVTTQGSPGSIASYATNSDGIFAVNNAPTGNGPTAIIVLPNLTPSYAFVVNGIDNTISTFSVSDEAGVGFDIGSLSAASTSAPLGSHLVAIASADPAGVPYLYVVDAGSNNVYAYSVDIATGVLTYIGTYVVGSAPTSIAIPFVNHNTG